MAEGVETTRCNTAPIGPDEIQVYTNGVDLLYHAAGVSRWINFGISEERLQEAAIACTGHPLELPTKDAVWVQLSRGKRCGLIQLADDAFAIGRTLETTGISPELAAALSRGLVSSYVDALCEADTAGGRRKPNLSARQHFLLLLACERIAISEDAREMDLADIAQRSGYSRRALELIFNRTLGMPSGRWFMNIRLNGVLRELLTAAPECRVADVATRWGFRHLARFAGQYRGAFGELPSQTLQRVRA
jgi:AraC-like DNA-binding protein